jgi:hypothetical protein
LQLQLASRLANPLEAKFVFKSRFRFLCVVYKAQGLSMGFTEHKDIFQFIYLFIIFHMIPDICWVSWENFEKNILTSMLLTHEAIPK